MLVPENLHNTLLSAWDVLVLFLIPIGGGIPGGVVLAKNRGLSWPIMMLLYFISDVILACVFEPLMLLFLRANRERPFWQRFREAWRKSMSHTLDRYGLHPSPFALVMITFGTDPMTGRAVAKAAGHGFFSGWALTIAGDMLFFTVIMASTLWLNNVLGDGTMAAVIITVAIVILPSLLRKIREGLFKQK